MHTFNLIVDSMPFTVAVSLAEAAALLGCLWLVLRAECVPGPSEGLSPERKAAIEQGKG